jgi:hypothetical protein
MRSASALDACRSSPPEKGSPEREAVLTIRTGLDTGFVRHETRVVKNVTVTLDEETARWARIEAARRDVSVSSLLRDMLREHMGGRDSYAGAMERYLSRGPRKLGGPRPSRDDLHDRAGLR